MSFDHFYQTEDTGGILLATLDSTKLRGALHAIKTHRQMGAGLKQLESQKNMQTGQQRPATLDSWTTVFVSNKPKSILQGNKSLIWQNANFPWLHQVTSIFFKAPNM